MLFNSAQFILVFLPVTLCVFFLLGRIHMRAAAAWLALASLGFYGWWYPQYIALLIASIAFNFSVGSVIGLNVANGNMQPARHWLIFGIVANLSLLAYYKYAGFFASSLNTALGSSLPVSEIILPLGISFFTFTQIAFLVDAYQGKARDYNPIHYSLFVTYFPHLIAGPILHHKQMMPQFDRPDVYRFSAERLAEGSTIFLLGLAKKVVLADRFGEFAEAGFSAAANGESVSFFAAWGAALSYSFQLYFDFSGYSDMAIGLGLMIGVQLPINFNSPYKSQSIIEFWRRWHMTLSAFLRDYLYVPLGGNRNGTLRRYVNLTLTMLLGGLWHGAGWTFVVWGGMHGFLLIVNHSWRAALDGLSKRGVRLPEKPLRPVYWVLTFTCVVVTWVIFRADSLDAALLLLNGMTGQSGVYLPSQIIHAVPALGLIADGLGSVPYLANGSVMGFVELVTLLVIGLFGVLCLPTVLDQTARTRWMFLILSGAFVIQAIAFGRPSAFLYFQF